MERIDIYFLKSFVFIFLLLGLSLIIHHLPVFALAFVYIIILLINSTLIMYVITINKIIKEHRYQKNSWKSWFNHKKTIAFIISVIVSLIPTFLFIYEIQTWQWHTWVAILAFIFFFYFCYKGISYLIGTQYVERHKQRSTLKYSFIIPFFMAFAFMLYEYFFVIISYNHNILESIYYFHYKILLNQSSSYLISDISQIMSIIHAFNGYIINRTFDLNQLLNFLWIFITYTAIFVNIASIFIFCIIPSYELKRIFQPLSIDSAEKNNEQIQKGYFILIFLICFLFIILFLYIEHEYSKQIAHEYSTWLREIERKIYYYFKDILDIIIPPSSI